MNLTTILIALAAVFLLFGSSLTGLFGGTPVA